MSVILTKWEAGWREAGWREAGCREAGCREAGWREAGWRGWMLNCRPGRLYRNVRLRQTNAPGVVVQHESLKRKMENELTEGYKTEI